MKRSPVYIAALCAVAAIVAPSVLAAQEEFVPFRPTITIKRVSQAPTLEDFLGMKPSPQIEAEMTKISGFTQRDPIDGAPSTLATDVYMGYDDKNLYVVYVAFDDQPEKVRARMARRESVDRDDDLVYINIDTYNDERRGYEFGTNAYGIQFDSLFAEGSSPDRSFDTLWYSRGERTDQGFVVWFALPFKSLRFPATAEQTWGILFERWSPHTSDWSFWPQASTRVQGFLNQTARIKMENISPGRNVQLIPYAAARGFRALDTELPEGPAFVEDFTDVNIGLDAKMVIKDSVTVDATVNPDFNQVESDEPQVTANQRFEVFFPEKRPFFIENAQYFETPINLFFSRRIADPSLGARLTGKIGPWAIGALVTDDEAPGKRALPGSPLRGQNAFYGIFRASRDVFEQGSVGAMYTDWSFDGSSNRVGGADFRFKLTPNLSLKGQAVASSTTFQGELGELSVTGPAYDVTLDRSGRHLRMFFGYTDISDDFRSVPGFVTRRDIRELSYSFRYLFRPEGTLISWGPTFFVESVWDHNGVLLDEIYNPGLVWNFMRQTSIELEFWKKDETLRPKDFPVLIENRVFPQEHPSISFRSSLLPALSVDVEYTGGTTINFNPPAGEEPEKANQKGVELELTIRPANAHRIDTTYLLTQLTEPSDGARIFDNHIFRLRWNWQFNRELSLRLIGQYDALLSNESLTSLPTVKNLNFDALVTYLVNPWTALYVGYNGNAQNIDLIDTPNGRRLIRPRSSFENDAWQIFVKFSYLFRF